MNRTFWLILLASGCASDFTFPEAEQVARAAATAGVGAHAAAWDDFHAARRRSTTSELDWEEGEDLGEDPDGDPLEGWTFSGTLSSDGPLWTGAMTADGSLAVSDDYAAWDLAIGYQEVATSDVTIDGDLAFGWLVDIESDGFTMEMSLEGDLSVTGEAEGDGAIDATATVDVSGSSASIEVDGHVDGRPVDFSMTINVPS